MSEQTEQKTAQAFEDPVNILYRHKVMILDQELHVLENSSSPDHRSRACALRRKIENIERAINVLQSTKENKDEADQKSIRKAD